MHNDIDDDEVELDELVLIHDDYDDAEVDEDDECLLVLEMLNFIDDEVDDDTQYIREVDIG